MKGVQRDDHGMTDGEIADIQSRYGKGPNLAADLAVLTARWHGDEPDLRMLLIQRNNKPFRGFWALPGGFVDMDEDLESAARRELQEETGIRDLGDTPLEQIGAFGHPSRDPRSRVVSIVYLAWVQEDSLPDPKGSDDAAMATFVRIRDGVVTDDAANALALAFDHDHVLGQVWERIRWQAASSSIPLLLLPERFSSQQVVALYEALSGPCEPQNLLSWLRNLGWILPDGPTWTRPVGLPARAPSPWFAPGLTDSST